MDLLSSENSTGATRDSIVDFMNTGGAYTHSWPIDHVQGSILAPPPR
jgi:hypothetical protein